MWGMGVDRLVTTYVRFQVPPLFIVGGAASVRTGARGGSSEKYSELQSRGEQSLSVLVPFGKTQKGSNQHLLTVPISCLGSGHGQTRF